MKIAILGATGHIGKGLLEYFYKKADLYLFARNKEKLLVSLPPDFSGKYYIDTCFTSAFPIKFDLVINCIGVGSPKKLGTIIPNSETFIHVDRQIIGYLLKNPSTVYINLSSGIVEYPQKDITDMSLLHYRRVKLLQEKFHNSFMDLPIVDIRIFGYYSRYIYLDSGFLLSDILNSVANNTFFTTDCSHIVRNYISLEELGLLITFIKDNYMILPRQIDCGSMESVSKQEILNYFNQEYGLVIHTYLIPKYTPIQYYEPKEVIYCPTKRTSLDIIKQETIEFFNLRRMSCAHT